MALINIINGQIIKSTGGHPLYVPNIDLARGGDGSDWGMSLFNGQGIHFNGVELTEARKVFDGNQSTSVSMTKNSWIARVFNKAIFAKYIRLYAPSSFGTNWELRGCRPGDPANNLAFYKLITNGAESGILYEELIYNMQEVKPYKAYMFRALDNGVLSSFEIKIDNDTYTNPLTTEITSGEDANGNILPGDWYIEAGNPLICKFDFGNIVKIKQLKYFGDETNNTSIKFSYSTNREDYVDVNVSDQIQDWTIEDFTGSWAKPFDGAHTFIILPKINNEIFYNMWNLKGIKFYCQQGFTIYVCVVRELEDRFVRIGQPVVVSNPSGGEYWRLFTLSSNITRMQKNDFIFLSEIDFPNNSFVTNGSRIKAYYYGTWDIVNNEYILKSNITQGSNDLKIKYGYRLAHKNCDLNDYAIDIKLRVDPPNVGRKYIDVVQAITDDVGVNFYEDSEGIIEITGEVEYDYQSEQPTTIVRFVKNDTGQSKRCIAYVDPDAEYEGYGCKVSFVSNFNPAAGHCANSNITSCLVNNSNWGLKNNPVTGVQGCCRSCPDWVFPNYVTSPQLIPDGDLVAIYVKFFWKGNRSIKTRVISGFE